MAARLQIIHVEGVIENGELSALTVELFSQEIRHILLTIQGQKTKPNLIREIAPGRGRLVFDREIIEESRCVCGEPLTLKVFCLADASLADQWTGKLVCREKEKIIEDGQERNVLKEPVPFPLEREKERAEVFSILEDGEFADQEQSFLGASLIPAEPMEVPRTQAIWDKAGEPRGGETISAKEEAVPSEEKREGPIEEERFEAILVPPDFPEAKREVRRKDLVVSGSGEGIHLGKEEPSEKEGPEIRKAEREKIPPRREHRREEAVSFPWDEENLSETEGRRMGEGGEVGSSIAWSEEGEKEEEKAWTAEVEEITVWVTAADGERKGSERPSVEDPETSLGLPYVEITEVKCFSHQGAVAEILVEGKALNCKSLFLKIEWQNIKYFQIVFPSQGKFLASFDREIIQYTPIEPLDQIFVTALSIADSAVSDTWKQRPRWLEKEEEGRFPEASAPTEAKTRQEKPSERLILEKPAVSSGQEGDREKRNEAKQRSVLPLVLITQVTGITRRGQVQEIVVEGHSTGGGSLFIKLQLKNIKFFQRVKVSEGRFRATFDHEWIRSKAKEGFAEMGVSVLLLDNPEVSDNWKGPLSWREEEKDG